MAKVVADLGCEKKVEVLIQVLRKLIFWSSVAGVLLLCGAVNSGFEIVKV